MHILKLIIYFLIPYFIGTFTIPKVKELGIRYKLYDFPSKRKIHKYPLIRIGGVGIIISFYVSLFLINYFELDTNIFADPIIYGPLMFSFIGFFDDIFDISVKKKLLGQILISVFLYLKGVNIGNLYDFSSYFVLFEVLNKFDFLFTIIWIVGITNAINWIDGLDGLATGISSIFIFSLITISLFQNDVNSINIFILLLGSCLAFLKSNYYPANIIMGDVGSYFLGSFLSIASIKIFSANSDQFSIFIPTLMLFIPLADMLRVILTRILSGASPFLPDQTHLHHKLINQGISHKNTVKIIYFFSLISSLLGLLLFLNI